MRPFRAPLAGLAILLAVTAASAQAPSTLSFQGRLTDNVGNPINNPTQSMTFALYKGATKIWEETQSVNVVDGLYNVLLGSVVPVDTIRFNQPIDLGVKVGADPEMTPRTQLAATAVARSLPALYTFWHEDQFNDGHNLIMGFGQADPGVAAAVILGGGIHGVRNIVTDDYGTVGGGQTNRAGTVATVAGGSNNQANGSWSVISGGSNNGTTNQYSVISGGALNRTNGDYAAVPGGRGNHARGLTSFAAGYSARAIHDGTFVWNDRSVLGGNDSLLSTAANQFIVRAAGGVGINRAPANLGIHLKQPAVGVGVQNIAGIRMEHGGDTFFWDVYVDFLNDINFGYNGDLKAWINDTDGSYTAASDASLKEDVQLLGDALPSLLQLRPSSYRFINAAAPGRSIGFLAQEIEPLFPELVSEKDGIKGVNYSGLSVIAIKAIQEMYASFQTQLEEQRALLERQQAEISRLTQLVNSQ